MTKKEIAEIIESKAAEYGFEMAEHRLFWATNQTNKSYIRIDINEKENESKTSWEDRKIWMDIEATGSICKMGGNDTPDELLKASDEIARGAKFAAEINGMRLSYIETF